MREISRHHDQPPPPLLGNAVVMETDDVGIATDNTSTKDDTQQTQFPGLYHEL